MFLVILIQSLEMELELRRGGQPGTDLDQSKELVRLQQQLEKLEASQA